MRAADRLHFPPTPAPVRVRINFIVRTLRENAPHFLTTGEQPFVVAVITSCQLRLVIIPCSYRIRGCITRGRILKSLLCLSRLIVITKSIFLWFSRGESCDAHEELSIRYYATCRSHSIAFTLEQLVAQPRDAVHHNSLKKIDARAYTLAYKSRLLLR